MRRKESRAAVSRPSSPAGLGFFSEEAFVPRRAKRSPAADAGLECRRKPPQNGRTGGSGGHFALGIMAPRRPFCPLSAGGKWTNAPQRFAAGALFYKTASVAAHSGSLRHDAGTRRRSPLCGQTTKRCGVHKAGLLRSGMRRGIWLRILSLSRLRRQLPRQREPRTGEGLQDTFSCTPAPRGTGDERHAARALSISGRFLTAPVKRRSSFFPGEKLRYTEEKKTAGRRARPLRLRENDAIYAFLFSLYVLY